MCRRLEVSICQEQQVNSNLFPCLHQLVRLYLPPLLPGWLSPGDGVKCSAALCSRYSLHCCSVSCVHCCLSHGVRGRGEERGERERASVPTVYIQQRIVHTSALVVCSLIPLWLYLSTMCPMFTCQHNPLSIKQQPYPTHLSYPCPPPLPPLLSVMIQLAPFLLTVVSRASAHSRVSAHVPHFKGPLQQLLYKRMGF